jgi:hypothetical protein
VHKGHLKQSWALLPSLQQLDGEQFTEVVSEIYRACFSVSKHKGTISICPCELSAMRLQCQVFSARQPGHSGVHDVFILRFAQGHLPPNRGEDAKIRTTPSKQNRLRQRRVGTAQMIAGILGLD